MWVIYCSSYYWFRIRQQDFKENALYFMWKNIHNVIIYVISYVKSCAFSISVPMCLLKVLLFRKEEQLAVY